MATADIYRERAYLLALLATHYPSLLVYGADANEPDWPILFISLPTGQAAWHIAPGDVELFDNIPTGMDHWDGHTTEEKYRRVMRHARSRAEHRGPECSERHTYEGRCELRALCED